MEKKRHLVSGQQKVMRLHTTFFQEAKGLFDVGDKVLEDVDFWEDIDCRSGEFDEVETLDRDKGPSSLVCGKDAA